MDEILKNFAENLSMENKEERLELRVLTNIREWFERIKKEHRDGKKCEFPALNKYFKSIEEEMNGNVEIAKEDIKEAKEIMESDAANGKTFVKEVFENLIRNQYSKLHNS